MFRRITAIITKEFLHISRDWQTLLIVLLMPVIMMFLYGYALTMDLSDLPVLIVNHSPSQEIDDIVTSIDASDLFSVTNQLVTSSDPIDLFKKYHVKAIIRFGNNFTTDLHNGGTSAPVQVLIDGSDPNTATILRNTIEPMLTKIILDKMNISQPVVVNVQPRILYNPQQKSALYFVPGLMAVILLMISAMLTSLAITREKELGTLEQLLVSPLTPAEIIIGKIIPYLFLAILDGILILLVGKIAFEIKIAGSLLFLSLASAIYIFTSLSIGLLISTITSTQQQAMMMVLPVTMLPTIVLSGFIFPLSSLPLFLRAISSIIPATYYLQIIRGIILKGVGLNVLWQQTAILSCIGLFFVLISIRKFKVKL
ncbi:MAG: ABC transporter permease [Fibrobacter sp.]|nr:ABC transporter permease [Fibrobacter sp.]